MKKFKFISFLLIVIYCICISGCEKEHEHNYINGACSCGEAQIIKYTVTFVDHDGSVLKIETVEKNQSATSPTVPSREGYDFIGWSAEFNNVISNLTVIAQYKLHEHKFIEGTCSCGEAQIIKYTVIWQNYDGTILEIDDNVISGTLPIYDGSIPVKSSDAQYSYVFSGWNQPVTEVTKDITYIAIYDKVLENSKISFELNGGTTSYSTESIYRPSIEINDFFFDVHKEGYNFRGWSYEGKRVFDEKGNKLFNPELKPSMIFTADFAQDVILNITVNIPNAGRVTGDGIYTYNTNVDVTATPNQGYSFEGWYYNGILLSNQESYLYMMWSEDVTLEARFIIESFNLCVESAHPLLGAVMIQGNSIYKDVDNKSVQYISSISISAYTNTEEYRFLGWYDIDGELVTTNAVYTFVMKNYDYKLYAKWDAPSFNVNVINDDNKGNIDVNELYEYNSEVVIKATASSGYTFDGWYLDEEKVSSDTIYSFDMPYNDVILEARWKLMIYNITYLDGGKIIETNNPSTYTIEEEIILEDIIKPGYIGTWLLKGEEIRKVEKGTTSDLIISVMWNPNKYNLNVTSEDEIKGIATIISGSGYSDEFIEVKANSENGYALEGWYIDSIKVSSDIIYSFTMPYNDVTLEARWVEPLTIIDGVVVSCAGSIKKIDIPNSAIAIGDSAFKNCTNLTSITIPESVTSIGNSAFYKCKSLASITIPESVTSIGDAAFEYCTNLTSITIPNSVTSIGNSAFNNCESLTSITIPNSVTSIGFHAFSSCDSLTSITIPNSVTSIGDRAFYNCESLTSIIVDDGNSYYKSIDGNLYTEDGKVLIQYATGKSETEFIILNSVTSIGEAAFYSCESLTSITIPNSVTNIGDSAFSFCYSLTSITIPNSVTIIGDSAFYSCKSLTSITIPNSVTSIGDSAFENCTNLTSIIVDDGNSYYKSIDGNLYTEDGKVLIQYAIGKSETEFIIPNSVTSIGDSAFYKCKSLASITIPESVTSIGNSAFYYCESLASITIPESVTSIGNYAFSFCESLTIYCEAASQPSGWGDRWNNSNIPVYWAGEWEYDANCNPVPLS